MGTDRHENDIRRKGRPAGRGKGGTNLRDAFAVTNPEGEQQVTDRYLEDEETPAQNVRVKNPNRNPDKGTQD
ncbi:hypothetical protein JHJ32_00725 [Parapedobacter sp. ISTM3]|uniref:Uncharacterized protein n=1 Tax=Parapedobacter luteus TaxID=623280 RepID=A0A1T5DA93_9SPHI|nr:MULTISPECIES: hypothetical protein [Parapedobacter]MBK1438496.1 hypothetical protein [Parapedobacter sp. ISTM3]SKB68569.1 hypothetical protein SAMN05660226_02649 [Parapedobacter luteus]